MRIFGDVLDDFDRDSPAKTRVAGAVHRAHPAGADRAEDFVRTEAIAGGQPHHVCLCS